MDKDSMFGNSNATPRRADRSAALRTAACAALVLAVTALAPAQAAQGNPAVDLVRDFAPGTITTRDAAERALAQARVAQQGLLHAYELQAARCDHTFFVNSCKLAARGQRRDGDNQVRRVTLEAHDLQRQLDAQDHAQARSAEQGRQAEQELVRPERERQATASAQLRQQNAQQRAQDAQLTQQRAAQDSAATAARQQAQLADHTRQEALRPRQESVAQRDYQGKQKDAASYAGKRAGDRIVNNKRRADRQKTREAQAAADQAASAAHGAGAAKP